MDRGGIRLRALAEVAYPDDDQFANLALEALRQARRAAENAYAPYSEFPVGAAAVVRKGAQQEVFPGCNVENASFGGTICAERVAMLKAVSEGFREFELLALSTPKTAGSGGLEERAPCGFCRQMMAEFFTEQTWILIDGGDGQDGITRGDLATIDILLPWRFRL